MPHALRQDMAAAFASALPSALNPFVRRLVHSIGSCCGTNKSQFCYRDHKGKLPKKFDLRNAIATEIGLEYTQMVSNAKKMTGLEIE